MTTTPEIIFHNDADGVAWSDANRDRLFLYRYETPNSIASGWVKRTGHGHAVARALLARARERGTEVPWVEIWDRDSGGTRLAYVTDPSPVSDNLEGLERKIEDARQAKHAFDKLRAEALELASDIFEFDVTPGADWNETLRHEAVSANQLARMLDGVASRPTVLKALRSDLADLPADAG